jgi:hypothetical protein
MNDRDYFAAAVLKGLLASHPRHEPVNELAYAKAAFEVADAMLRERDRVAESPESQHVAETCRTTYHDAAPAATAADVAPSPRQGEIGIGNQQDDGPGDGWRYLEPGEVREAGDEFRSMGRGWRPVDDPVGAIVYPGEGRQYRRRIAAAPPRPPASGPTLTDAEREAVRRILTVVRERLWFVYADEICTVDGLLARLGGGA